VIEILMQEEKAYKTWPFKNSLKKNLQRDPQKKIRGRMHLSCNAAKKGRKSERLSG